MKKFLKLKIIMVFFLVISLLSNVTGYQVLASVIDEDTVSSNEIITSNYMTEEEINHITEQYPGIVIDPSSLLKPESRATVIQTPLLVTVLTESGANYKLTAKNVSSKGTTVFNTYLVAQVKYKTSTGQVKQEAIQRYNGTVLVGQSVSETFGGWAIFYNLQSIIFFAYGTANGVINYTTPIVI